MLTEVDPVQTEKAQGPDITERGHFRECLGSTMVLDPELQTILSTLPDQKSSNARSLRAKERTARR